MFKKRYSDEEIRCLKEQMFANKKLERSWGHAYEVTLCIIYMMESLDSFPSR